VLWGFRQAFSLRDCLRIQRRPTLKIRSCSKKKRLTCCAATMRFPKVRESGFCIWHSHLEISASRLDAHSQYSKREFRCMYGRFGGLKAPVYGQLATVILKLKGDKSLRSSPLLSKGEVCETAGFWTLKAAQLAGTGPHTLLSRCSGL